MAVTAVTAHAALSDCQLFQESLLEVLSTDIKQYHKQNL